MCVAAPDPIKQLTDPFYEPFKHVTRVLEEGVTDPFASKDDAAGKAPKAGAAPRAAHAPDEAARRAALRALLSSGQGRGQATLLTGPSGVDPTQLNLGKTALTGS